MAEGTKRLALVASKGTLDQAYPPLILATTAASMGWEAGIFFTFSGRATISSASTSSWGGGSEGRAPRERPV